MTYLILKAGLSGLIVMARNASAWVRILAGTRGFVRHNDGALRCCILATSPAGDYDLSGAQLKDDVIPRVKQGNSAILPLSMRCGSLVG